MQRKYKTNGGNVCRKIVTVRKNTALFTFAWRWVSPVIWWQCHPPLPLCVQHFFTLLIDNFDFFRRRRRRLQLHLRQTTQRRWPQRHRPRPPSSSSLLQTDFGRTEPNELTWVCSGDVVIDEIGAAAAAAACECVRVCVCVYMSLLAEAAAFSLQRKETGFP